MCGFLGILYRDPTQAIDLDRLMYARDTMVHRGPDEAGVWSTENNTGIGLGHRRLKILDLTHGQQPMVTPNHRRALVFNGEIYNHQDLRKKYPASNNRGGTGKTGGRGDSVSARDGGYMGDGDTESLFAALNHAGIDAITQLHGMFALAHYDDVDRSLLLARDRLGQKPLYYHIDDQAITFGSELKSILALLDRQFPIDPVALDHYFARGYVPAPRTIFQGIYKLPAAHYLTMDANRWAHSIEAYWDVASPSVVDVPTDPDAIIDRLDELLTDSVRERLISDVPIGCLLSGGVDSSLITAIASKIAKNNGDSAVKTFSIGFDEPGATNELPDAQQVAEYLGCDWEPRTQRGGDFMTALDDVAQFYDEPYGNPTSVAMRTLSKLCHEQLTVVLSGQGGDELTAGYPGRYDWVLQTPDAKPIDDALHQTLRTSFVPWRDGRQPMLAFDAVSPRDELQSVMRGEFDRLNRVLYGDLKRNLPDYLVTIEERMSMSASLEARNPLLDHRVVDFLMALPMDWKIRDGQHKWPLVSLLRRYLPDDMVDRPKRGFTPPMGKWIVEHGPALAKLIRSMETMVGGEGMGQAIYKPAWWDYLVGGQYQPEHTMPVFYAVMLAMWFKHYGQYVAGLGMPPPPCPPYPPYPPHPPHKSTNPLGYVAADLESNTRAIQLSPHTPPLPCDDWHAAFAEQSPRALVQGQWFCQAMENFSQGDQIQLVGDVNGYYAFLATGCGLKIDAGHADAADDRRGDHTVLIGFDALAAGPFTKTTVVLLPFALSEKSRMESALQQAMIHVRLLGYQAVQTDESHGMLIARFNGKHTGIHVQTETHARITAPTV